MAQNNKPLYTLYESLKSDNYDVPDNYDSFERTLTAPGAEGTNSRLALYKSLKDDGYDVPDTYDSFANTLFSAKPREREVQQQAVNAEAALTPVGNTGPMTIATNFSEESRQMVGDTGRMLGAMTPDGRKKQQGLEIAGRMAGRNTRLPGLSVAMPMPEQPEASEGTQPAPKAQDMRGPQYYGTVVDQEDGQTKGQWLMPDGSLTTDFYEADVAAGEARSARLQREFERRMAINGLDTSKPEDVAAQQAYDRLAQLEARAKMYSDEKLAKLEERYEEAGAMERGRLLIGQNGNTATSMVTIPASVYGNGIYDDEDKLIAAERKNLEDAITAHHAGKLKKTGFFFAAQNLVNAWEGVKDVLKDGDTYTAGMISMHHSAQVLAIKAKLDKGETLSRSEEHLLESILVKQTIDENVEKPHGYTMGYTIANMVPFMIQMAMNPAAGAGGKLGNMAVKEFAKMMAKRAGQRATKGFMMKAVAKLGKKRAAAIAKGIGVTAGDIVASASLANTLQAPATMADAALRHAGDVAYDKDGTLHFENGEGVIKAFAKAEGTMLIEDYTEMLGAHFGVIGGAIGRGTGKAVRKLGGGKLLDNVMKLCANIRATDWAKGIAAIERRAQWNGSVGEVLEEEAGIVLNSIFTGDNSISDLWDKEQQIDIVLGVGAFGAFVSGIKTAGYPIARHKARKALDERAATCEASFGKNWDSIRETIDMVDEADLAQTIAHLGKRYATTPEKAKALLEYASAMAKARAFNIASASAEEMQTNPEQRQIDQSYNNGYTAEGSGRVDVQNLYNARRERAINTLDADTMRNLDANPLATLSGMASAGTYTDEELSVAREYAAAKSAYDGMQQSVEDEIEAQIWRCNAAIDARTNRDTGMVQRATYGLENREVYIIKGNVVADENGVIDRSASDDTIAIVDLETGETKMVASKDLGQAEQPIAAEQFRSSMAAYVRQEIGDRARAQAEGRLLFEENEKCLILDDEGSQSEVTILGGATDEQGAPIADAVKVQYADGTTGVVAMSELQEQVNAAAAARMDYAEQELQQGAAARAAVDAEVDTDAEQDGLAVEDGGQRRSFALNDEVELIADQGGVTSGMITGEIDSDGLIEVQTDKPVNGQMVNRLTLDELMQLLTRHNGEIVDEAEVEAPGSADGANSAEVDDGFIPIDPELIPAGGVDAAEDLDARKPATPGTKADEAGDSGVADEADVAPSEEASEESEAGAETEEAQGVEAMPMRTVKEKGESWEEPDYLAATPERAHSYIYNESGLNRQEANGHVAHMAKAAKEAVDKHKKSAPKIGGSIVRYQKAKTEWEAKGAELQRAVDFWDAVMAEQKKVADAEKAALEAQQAQEHDEAVARFEEEQRIKAEKRAEQEAIGANAVNPQLKAQWDAAPKTVGNANAHVLADGSTITGHYVLTEAGAASASHDPNNAFAPTEGFPIDENGQNVNDRDYSRDKDAQRMVENMGAAFESSAVGHNQKQHGDTTVEGRVGQIAITAEDYTRIPEILESYDSVRKSPNRSRSTGNEVIIYEKEFEDGYVYYLEEKRDKRKSLSFQTMYKKKKGTDSSDGLMPNASPSTPTAPSDNFSSVSDGKVTNSASDKQGEDVKSSVQERLAAAEGEVNTEPSEAQKKAGNYKMGHVEIDGLQISIENPKGSMRRGKDPNGTPWETEMKNTYGYIKGPEGVDGDKIDVFLSDNPTDGDVYVVDQYNTDGTFDEHKVMYGFTSATEAEAAYLSNYSADWAKGRKVVVTGVTREEFKKWLDASDRKKKPFAEYKSVKPIEAQNGGATEAAEPRQKSSRLEIEGAEKLSAERAEAVERYAEGHYCVPIRVIADEADIRESGLSDVAVAQMMAALTEEGVPAVYCREDKKIYIFAGHKDSNVGSTLAHENFHALTDAIGDARENRYMLDEYRYLLLADLDHGEDFSRIWKAVADAYPPHKRAEEFVAYTVGLMYVSEGAAKAIRRILDGNAKSSIFQQLINPILYGTQTKTDAYRSANSENRRGGGAGVQQGRAGNSQAEGRADGEESAGGEVANEPRRRYVARKQATTTGMSLFDWADAEERERREVTTKDEKAIAAEEANAAIDGFVENYSRWLEHSVEIEAQLDAEGVEGELRDELAAQMESEEAGIAEERDKLEEKLRDYYALDNTPDDATKIAHDMVGRVQAEVEIRHRKEHILSDLLNGSDEAPIETTSDEVAAEEKTAEVKTGGGFISYNALGHLPDAKEGEFAYVERKFSRTGEFSFTGADKIRDRGDVAYLFRSLENYSVENVFAVLVKDGKARVLHIGMGTATSSLADMSAIRAGVDAFGADRIYLIHNHPSGTMVASQQDRNLMRTLEAAFGDKIDVSGIIIDTTSGRYVEFDGEGQAEVYDRPRQSDGDKMADVFHFDQADRSNMPEETMAIRSSSDVANAIGNLRFGEGKKVSYLILAHNGHVIGNFHTGYTDINASGLAEELASVASKYGGTSVVVYGNMPLDGVMRLKDAVARHSLGAVRLLDTLGVRNGIQMSAVDEGMLYEDGIPYGPAEVREPMVAARGREAFDALRDRVVAERGIVMPGLNEKVVRVVEVPRHDFAGNGKEALQAAEKWAKENIVGTHTALDSRGDEFGYTISGDAVEKYVSRSATGKSANIGVHLAALKKLPEIIKESIEAEVHPDYDKLNGIRNAENITNPETLIHRFYGAANVDGTIYRVKTTMREYRDKNRSPLAHSYEITQIELLEAPSDGVINNSGEPLAMTSNSSNVEPTVSPKDSGAPHRIANLLKGVEKSYDPGKKLLEESEKSELFRQGDERGSVADYSKIKKSVSASSQGSVGRDRFGEQRQAELAARERERMAARIRELAERLHLDNVEVVADASQFEGKRATAKGFFNKQTGKITIVLPNNLSTIDAEQTLLHEAVAHYGLRKLLGERFDTFLDNVYESATEEIRRKIAEMAARNGWNFRTATEEYLAGLAENTDFESISRDAASQSWWAKVKQLFIDMVERVGFKGFRDKVGVTLTDNELRYILWRSYANLAEPGATRSIFGEAADIAKQAELKVGNYAEGGIEAEYVEPEYVSAVNERFNEQLERWSSGVMRPEEVVQVGVPTGILSSLMPTVPILLRQKVLSKSRKKHGVSAAEMKNLPEALGRPIFVFKSSPETISVLTELKSADGNNLFVAIELGKDLELGGRAMIVNDILTIHGREIENVVLPILHNDSLVWADKKKGLEWLRSAKSNSQANTSQTLDDAAKKVKEFENPKLEEEELYRPGDFSPRDTAIARKEYERMVSSGGFQFQEAMQDSMLGLKKFYQAILGNDTQIEDVAGFENAYLFENRMSSMNAGEQHEYFRRFMEPLLKEIAKIAGANQRKRKELTDYLMAKHGLERNEHMRTKAAANGENADRDFAGLIGLTGEADWASAEATAKQWVDDYEKLHNTADLWKAINNATKATLEKVYLSGIISKKTYEEVRDMYEYYIPLRGWNETTSDQVYGYLTSKDGPLGGSIIKKAEGRSSMADDPIATIAMMADDAIRQGNRNLMKQRFLNFVLNHPSDVASVHDIWLEYDDVADEWRPVFADVEATDTADEVAQKVEAFEQRMESLKAAHPDKYKKGREAQHIPYKVVKNNLREHQVLIKRNGQTFVVTINGNPRAAQALNGLTNPDVELNNAVGDLLKLATWANRQLSAFYTTRNPDFVVSNFMRDMLYANCMTWVKESPRYALRFHKNFGKFAPISPRRLVRFRKGPNGGTVYSTGMLLRKWENGTLDMTDKYEKYFYEFMINGGETGYTNMRDIEGHKRAVAAELKKQSSVGRQAWAALGMQLDLLNRSVENCARFAAFVTSREFGRSIDRAIYDAKEVSVNFNKKGSGAKMAKAVGQTNLGKVAAYLGGIGRLVFIFWNAGIQGMANFGRQAKRHPAKFAAGATAMFTLGYIIPILAEMMGGGDGDDDDKNAYYNLPEYVRRSNICFRAGNQWISIPLPIEYRAMYGLGELAYGVTSGNERYSNKELAREIAAQVSQILPIDMLEGGGGWHAFIPSLFKPVTEAYLMNEGWTGLPIYRDNAFNKNDPEWTKAYASADNHLVDFTRWLNETTGGNDYKKGDIDINPAKLEYLLSGTFGGLFTFPNKGEKMRETMFGDREFEWRNMPIANRLIKSGDERTAYRKLQNEYYKYLEEYKETKRLYRKYEKADESGVLGYAERLDFLENSPEFLRAEIFDDFKDIIDANDNALNEETDKEIRAEIEAEQLADKRELVNALNDPAAYFRSLREAGMLSDDYTNYLERSFGMKLRIQGQ